MTVRKIGSNDPQQVCQSVGRIVDIARRSGTVKSSKRFDRLLVPGLGVRVRAVAAEISDEWARINQLAYRRSEQDTRNRFDQSPPSNVWVHASGAGVLLGQQLERPNQGDRAEDQLAVVLGGSPVADRTLYSDGVLRV
ncbi:MAG: hypothetical protein F2868_15110 [Actinobacteria bacterium]|nr:hypothetical protein [Actinomycetota bacterium]MSX94501.1 hypothetical protein [Actinomycetota bacterium]